MDNAGGALALLAALVGAPDAVRELEAPRGAAAARQRAREVTLPGADVCIFDGDTILRHLDDARDAQRTHPLGRGRLTMRDLANEALANGTGCHAVVYVFDGGADGDMERRAAILATLSELEAAPPDVRAKQLVFWSNGELTHAWTALCSGTNVVGPDAARADARAAQWVREYDRERAGRRYSVTSSNVATLAALCMHMQQLDARTRVAWRGGGVLVDLSALLAHADPARRGASLVSLAALLAAGGADGAAPVARTAELVRAWDGAGRPTLASVDARGIVRLADAALERVAAAAWGVETWALVHEARMRDATARVRALVEREAPRMPEADFFVAALARDLERGDATAPLRDEGGVAAELTRAQRSALARGLAWLSSIYAPLGPARADTLFFALVRWLDGDAPPPPPLERGASAAERRAARLDAYAAHLEARRGAPAQGTWRAAVEG